MQESKILVASKLAFWCKSTLNYTVDIHDSPHPTVKITGLQNVSIQGIKSRLSISIAMFCLCMNFNLPP